MAPSVGGNGVSLESSLLQESILGSKPLTKWNDVARSPGGGKYEGYALPTPQGFAFRMLLQGRIGTPTNTLRAYTYEFREMKLGNPDYAGNRPLTEAPFNTNRTFYSPISIASSPIAKIIVVAESGEDTEKNYILDGSTVKTVAESGKAKPGIHVRTGDNSWSENVLTGSWKTVSWVNDGFIAVSADGSKIATSQNGLNWTVSATDLGPGFTKIIKSSNGEYLALKQDRVPSATNKVLASSMDGIHWIGFNIGAKQWTEIVAENGCFVALATSGKEAVTTCK